MNKAFFAKSGPTRLALFLSKYLPPFIGIALTSIMARLLVIFKTDMYWAIRDNQRHISPELTDRELHRRVYRVFSHAARGYYELFHNVGRKDVNVDDFNPPVRFTPETERHFAEALASDQGLFILGCHLSNFDLGGVAFAHYFPEPLQVLSLAEPPAGFEVFNELRGKTGAIFEPISTQSLREAMIRLREGGTVFTGAERPTGEDDQPVTFFGATAYIPTGYIRLPLRTNALVMVLAVIYEEGAYWIHTTPAMEMEHTGDRKLDAEVNLQRVLEKVEAFIRRHPEQWMMFVPVWREESAE